MRPYIALFKSNMRLTLRDRAVLFFNYVFPLLFFFGFAGLFAGAGGPASPTSWAWCSPWAFWATGCGARACAPCRSAKPTSCAASK